MKIIFFGSGKFAVSILETMHKNGFDVSLVVSRPDAKKGRHLKLSATPVKEYALRNKIELFQPEDINSPDSIKTLDQKKADLFLVVSYGRILSKNVLSLPKIMPINIHSSLLPKYRGAAPISRALIKGEKITGVTFIKMNELMDEGDIIFQKDIAIESDDNSITLDEKLSRLAAEHTPQVINDIGKGRFKLKKQEDGKATYAPMLKKIDGLVLWHDTSKQIIDNFKGCFGWPGSFTYCKGKILKILSMKECVCCEKGQPGEIIKAFGDQLVVACSKGCVEINEVLPESHKKMSVRNFLSGHDVKIKDKLG
ncbi:MAG TPA: methionyl-tRNA formyltransferase [Candidatus Omnitrophota bacterium]|nr:methionyl-tRNA formyltransferase [Candidatus Omnitrophota bacterium]